MPPSIRTEMSSHSEPGHTLKNSISLKGDLDTNKGTREWQVQPTGWSECMGGLHPPLTFMTINCILRNLSISSNAYNFMYIYYISRGTLNCLFLGVKVDKNTKLNVLLNYWCKKVKALRFLFKSAPTSDK